jgi:penicillin-binding protein 1B
MLRSRLKTILLLFTIFLTLSIIGAAWAFWTLDKEMTQKMEQKQFLLPTEFYAYPQTFRAGSRWTIQELEGEFLKNHYRSRAPSQLILAGDFFMAEQNVCAERAGREIPTDTQNCIIFVPKKALPSEQNWIFVGSEGILALWTPQGSVPELQLEALLMAQYLENEPMVQKNVELSEIPVNCLNAVLAIEDQNFLEHSGFSITSFLRAVYKNVLAGRRAQGGSTITQQLVKNYFLTSERSFRRKAQELIMSILLEARFTKDQILETYLNIIYMGQNGAFRVHGFAASADYYFQKDLQELNLRECATLAAVLNSPGLYNPWKKPENATKRQNLVLSKMRELNFISEEDLLEAQQKSSLPPPPKAQAQETAPYYIDAVQKFLIQNDLPIDGVKIYTALDLRVQQKAQEAIQKHLDFLEKTNKAIKENKEKGLSLEGAVLSGDGRTGLVHAVVGGRSFRKTQFNRAIEGHRQVGSIMKPFVFLTALMSEDKEGHAYTPTTMLLDAPFTLKYEGQKWSPENYGKKYFGNVPMFFALKNSLNASTAQLAYDVGLPQIIDNAHQLGIDSELRPVPSLALGAFEIYPIEVLRSYMALSQMGRKPELSYVLRVESVDGDNLYEFEPQTEEFSDPEAVASLVGMMKQTILTGSARFVTQNGFQHPAAGKTGTTSEYRDTWFAGFTPDFTTVVWVGYDRNEKTGLTGASGAVPVWTEVMKTIVERTPMNDFDWPEGIEKETLSVEDLKSLNAIEPEAEGIPVELILKKGSR